MKNVIYTCIINEYDSIKHPLYISNKFEYICFSNKNIENSGIWKIYNTNTLNIDINNPTLLNRYIKWNPHIFLKNYNYSLYIDGSIQIIESSIYNKLNLLISNTTLISIPIHWQYNCMYEACRHILSSKKENKETIESWIDYCHRIGFPKKSGFWECGLIFRKHNDQYIINFNNSVWNYISNFSNRDQLSVPVAAKNNKINIIPWNNIKKSYLGPERFDHVLIYCHSKEWEYYFYLFYNELKYLRKKIDIIENFIVIKLYKIIKKTIKKILNKK